MTESGRRSRSSRSVSTSSQDFWARRREQVPAVGCKEATRLRDAFELQRGIRFAQIFGLMCPPRTGNDGNACNCNRRDQKRKHEHRGIGKPRYASNWNGLPSEGLSIFQLCSVVILPSVADVRIERSSRSDLVGALPTQASKMLPEGEETHC